LVVDPPSSIPAGTPERTRVARTDLARGEAAAPPSGIDVAQVLEQAFRHLAWLFRDDAVIAGALPGWNDVLDRYLPEPFRALG
jgi:hypothetical protein